MNIFIIIWVVTTTAFILSRQVKVKYLLIILVLHVGLNIAAYKLYPCYEKAHYEYVDYADEMNALDDNLGDPSWPSWPYQKDLYADELEDRQYNFRILLFGAFLLDICVLVYVGTKYRPRKI